jgi:hypothetical protein
MLENTEGTILRNLQHRIHKTKGQSRETYNIGYTRRRQTKHNTIQRNLQHRIHKTKGQSRETYNIGYTRRRDNLEKLTT